MIRLTRVGARFDAYSSPSNVRSLGALYNNVIRRSRDRPFLTVGVVARVADWIVRDDVVNEIFVAVVARLMRLAWSEEKGVAWADFARAAFVAHLSATRNNQIKFELEPTPNDTDRTRRRAEFVLASDQTDGALRDRGNRAPAPARWKFPYAGSDIFPWAICRSSSFTWSRLTFRITINFGSLTGRDNLAVYSRRAMISRNIGVVGTVVGSDSASLNSRRTSSTHWM